MSLARRALVVSAVSALVVAGLLIVWWAVDILLVLFVGVIFALAVRGAADRVAARLPVPPSAAVAGVLVIVLALAGLSAWLLSDEVARQTSELLTRLPEALTRLREVVSHTAWGEVLLERLPTAESLVSTRVMRQATGAVTATLGFTLGALANVVIVVFVTLYVAFAPHVYVQGIVRLVPPRRRRRAREVLEALAVTLQRWFVGRLLAMVVIGTLTALGLWFVGVPLALTLGLLAGVLNFVPYIGPLVSFVPAALLALLSGPTTLLWVLGLYLLVQTVESYVVTPLVEQQTVLLPPALTITAQVLLGVLVGIPGLLLATPVTAATIVLVKMLYVEDVLGEEIEVPGETAADAAPARHEDRAA